MSRVVEWGDNLITPVSSMERIEEDRKAGPGSYETDYYVEIEKPMTAHQWSAAVSRIVNKSRQKLPPGADVRYVAVEKSEPKVRVQWEVHPQTAFVTVAEIIGIIAVAVAAGLTLYYGWKILRDVTYTITHPFENIPKTVLYVGLGLAGLYVLTGG